MPYNNIIYATEQEARSYLIPYGTQMLFMDPTAPTFYVKTTDAFGSPSFDIYDFTPRSTSNSETPLTRADLESLRAEILSLITPQPQEVPHSNEQPQSQSVNAQQ